MLLAGSWFIVKSHLCLTCVMNLMCKAHFPSALDADKLDHASFPLVGSVLA